MISQEVSDLLYPWVVPVGCTVMLAAWIGNLLRHIRRLERDGVDIFAED